MKSLIYNVQYGTCEWMGYFHFLPALGSEYSGLSRRDKIWVEDCLSINLNPVWDDIKINRTIVFKNKKKE